LRSRESRVESRNEDLQDSRTNWLEVYLKLEPSA
jgi:hypothetical protein